MGGGEKSPKRGPKKPEFFGVVPKTHPQRVCGVGKRQRFSPDGANGGAPHPTDQKIPQKSPRILGTFYPRGARGSEVDLFKAGPFRLPEKPPPGPRRPPKKSPPNGDFFGRVRGGPRGFSRRSPGHPQNPTKKAQNGRKHLFQNGVHTGCPHTDTRNTPVGRGGCSILGLFSSKNPHFFRA
jgi:hypothetical protein